MSGADLDKARGGCGNPWKPPRPWDTLEKLKLSGVLGNAKNNSQNNNQSHTANSISPCKDCGNSEYLARQGDRQTYADAFATRERGRKQ